MANYCKNCGQPLEVDYKVCPMCGTRVVDEYYQSEHVQETHQQNELLWAILGFFFPVIGIVLFFIWQNTKPVIAKYIGIGALLGFGVKFILGFIGFSLFFPFFFFGIFTG